MTAVQLQNPKARALAVLRSRLLNRITIGWNLAEGVIALIAGTVAGSVSLVGFGLDSGIEVSAATILAWRLAKEGRGACMADFDRRATRLIAGSFAALAVYVAIQSARDLIARRAPEISVVGIGLAAVSLIVMPLLAGAKRRLAPVIGSRAAASEANQTSLCAILSAVVLTGLGLNATLGWWWADPTAGLVIAALAGVEAVRTWRAEALADTCCA